MITIDRPCCDQPLTVETPLASVIHCDACAVSWDLVDPAPREPVALAA